MKTKARVIHVDGVDYPILFDGFNRPLKVRTAGGPTLTLMPWRYRDHMTALNSCLNYGRQGLVLDRDRFCDCVIRNSNIPADYAEYLSGIALWWAGGGNNPVPASPGANGWLDLGSTRIKIEPWSNEDRIRALAGSLVEDASGQSLDVVHYLDAMVRASVKAIDPQTALDDLDADATARLITAAVTLNMPEDPFPFDGHGHDSIFTAKHSRSTLRLCAALGWTPSKVWQTPAAEVDRLLALLDRIQPATSGQFTRRPGLADQPDAVVIHFEED
jgi:hypothetical protein